MTSDTDKTPILHRLTQQAQDLPVAVRGCVLAIGNFDGVHRGHQAVLQQARNTADQLGVALAVMLFDPHPRQFFAPDAPPFRLTRLITRARLLRQAGVDFTLILPFDAAMAACEAADFVQMILHDKIGVAAVVVGHDFRFGKGRHGDFALLQKLGAHHDFAVAQTDIVTLGDSDAPYSSSAIRQALRDGQPEQAAAMLGRDWAIEGQVQQGDQRGRTIGFATANMALDDYVEPHFGVYAVQAEIMDGALAGNIYQGVANIGLRPTVGTDKPRLEAHLFAFDADIYDANMRVALTHFIRPEQKFDGLDALKTQIAKDCQTAREMLGLAARDC